MVDDRHVSPLGATPGEAVGGGESIEAAMNTGAAYLLFYRKRPGASAPVRRSERLLASSARSVAPYVDSAVGAGEATTAGAGAAERRAVVRGRCVECGTVTTLKCSRCKLVHFCSRDCQAKCWRAHKIVCAGSL